MRWRSRTKTRKTVPSPLYSDSWRTRTSNTRILWVKNTTLLLRLFYSTPLLVFFVQTSGKAGQRLGLLHYSSLVGSVWVGKLGRPCVLKMLHTCMRLEP